MIHIPEQQQKEKNEDAAVIDLDEFGTTTKQFDKLEEVNYLLMTYNSKVGLRCVLTLSNHVNCFLRHKS